jgi:hypothetical protein
LLLGICTKTVVEEDQRKTSCKSYSRRTGCSSKQRKELAITLGLQLACVFWIIGSSIGMCLLNSLLGDSKKQNSSILKSKISNSLNKDGRKLYQSPLNLYESSQI